MTVYKLYCEDAEVLVCGDKCLELDKAVKEALKAMSYEEIVDPEEDWFEVLVDKFCEKNGFKRVEEDSETDVEELYFDEVATRFRLPALCYPEIEAPDMAARIAALEERNDRLATALGQLAADPASACALGIARAALAGNGGACTKHLKDQTPVPGNPRGKDTGGTIMASKSSREKRAIFLIKWFLEVFDGVKAPYRKRNFSSIAKHMRCCVLGKGRMATFEAEEPHAARDTDKEKRTMTTPNDARTDRFGDADVDQFGDPIPGDLVMLPTYADLAPEDAGKVDDSAWYVLRRPNGRYSAPMASAKEIGFLSETDPLDCDINLDKGEILKVDDCLKRGSDPDGFYTA